MAWLIGAIATYGVVLLLIGITVLVHLLGNRGAGAADAEADSRTRFRHPRRDAAAGTGAFAVR
jgi:hypothetical protein